jgi:hypothetical protein
LDASQSLHEEDAMKNLSKTSVVIFLLFAFSVTAFAKKKEHKEVAVHPPSTAFPAAYTKVVPGMQRFENLDYFKLMAAEGLTKVDAKALYSRLQAAVSANEGYKALYLARVLTQIEPSNAAMWTNRAQLAMAIGVSDEAAACLLNAKNPAQAVKVPLTGVLPGQGLGMKPSTLADWAGATAMISDGVAEKEGKQALVAFKDSVSGIHEATEAEVKERDNEARESGLTPPGPWATPEPVQLKHVLGNVFAERAADPMHFKSISKGGMFGAMLMAGLSGANMNINPGMAQQGMVMAQQMAGRASEVPSHYRGGSYTRVTFADGKELDTADHPQTAGLDETVANPVPFLWASGGSMEPAISAVWQTNQKLKVQRITTENVDDINNAKEFNPPGQLQFPKLMSLCVGNDRKSRQFCTDPMTLMELLLTPEDIAAVAPSLSASVQDVDMYRKTYGSLYLTLRPGNGGGSQMWAADGEGAVYRLKTSPTAWVVAAQ